MLNLGFDFKMFRYGILFPIRVPMSHLVIVGSSGSGKTTLLQLILYHIICDSAECYNVMPDSFSEPLYMICDFKKSKDLFGISDFYAEFDECYDLIKQFYQRFLETPEGGMGYDQILIIDEVAGMLSYYGMSKKSKEKADEIRSIMANILMLGRSRRCYLWLVMQRYSANIFPPASGAADNFPLCIGLSRLSPDSKKSLFAGMELDFDFIPKPGRGIVYAEGQPLRALCVPNVNKKTLIKFIQKTQIEAGSKYL